MPSRAEKAEIAILNKAEFTHYWPKIEEVLDSRPDLWQKWTTKEGFVMDVMGGKLQVWVASPGSAGPITLVFATRLCDTWAGRVLQVPIAFGEGAVQMMPCLEGAIDRMAAFSGCTRIESTGRRGWERVLKPEFGWEFMGTTMTRPVRNLGKGN